MTDVDLMAELDELATFSDDPHALTRLYLSPSHKAAAAWVLARMRRAGMVAEIDAAGTVAGRYEGTSPGLRAILLGSHIDTVRDAGKYDGNLGVMLAIAAVERLHRQGRRLPFAIEVLAFGDEEGVRFPNTFAGSKAVAGLFDMATLTQQDIDGRTHEEALRAFGLDPAAIPAAARKAEHVLGYLEIHIEQGPVLESMDLPLGVVTAISGASRFRVVVEGVPGHAGTVPMPLRQDALAAAAEMVLEVEKRAQAEPDLVATVGWLEAAPGAINVIPGRCRFSVDLRSPSDAVRRRAVEDLERSFRAIAGRRRVGFQFEPFYSAPAAPCAPRLVEALAAAIGRAGFTPPRLPSGAGHDAMALRPFCDIGMLFVRCKGGISHNPAESVRGDDVEVALTVLLDTLEHLAPDAPAMKESA